MVDYQYLLLSQSAASRRCLIFDVQVFSFMHSLLLDVELIKNIFPFCRLPLCLNDDVSTNLLISFSSFSNSAVFGKSIPVPMSSKQLSSFSSI